MPQPEAGDDDRVQLTQFFPGFDIGLHLRHGGRVIAQMMRHRAATDLALRDDDFDAMPGEQPHR